MKTAAVKPTTEGDFNVLTQNSFQDTLLNNIFLNFSCFRVSHTVCYLVDTSTWCSTHTIFHYLRYEHVTSLPFRSRMTLLVLVCLPHL